MTENVLSYCGDLVRRHDPDRFLISLVMPSDRREALWALFAFNYEIAKTREVVTETTLGLIRLQWWRDAIGEIYGGREPRQNEILPALAAAIKDYGLPRDAFDLLIYAREFDLENIAPGSMEGLEIYAEQTQAPLVRLALLILGQEEAEDVVLPVAKAYSLTGIMRVAPFHAAQRRCYFPSDRMAEHPGSENSFYRCEPDEGMVEIMRGVVDRADTLLAVKPRSRFVKAMRVLSGLYLNQIKGVGGNVFRLDPAEQPAFLHLRFLFKMAF